MSFGMAHSVCALFFILNLIVMTKSASVSINENAAVNSHYDINFGPGTTVAFETKPTEFDLLSNGTLVVKSMLDYETKTTYNYNVRVTSSTGTKTESLTIIINDINDMAPMIIRPIKPSAPYPLGLPDNATAVLYRGVETRDGAVIYCVQATDVDKNANLTFDFFPSEDLDATTKDNFRIISDLGCIVRKGNTLLPSTPLEYRFPVRVRDINSEVAENSSSYVTVTAHVTPQNPQFGANPYLVYFLENTPANTIIGAIKALPLTNIYANLSYSLTPLEPYERPWPFTFNTANGELTVTKTFSYNVSCKYEWHANVTVTESSTLRSHTKVSIVLGDTNDHRPIFQQSVYFNGKPVNEDVDTNEIILNVTATDPDVFYPTNLKYSLHGQNSSFFEISTVPSSTVGMIRRVKPLDYEALGSTKAYQMTVSVTDGIGAAATATVVIYVMNVNDNAPKFSSANGTTVPVQRKLIDQVVFQAHAYDADGSIIEYYFAGKTSSETYFAIDKVSGAVKYTKETPSNIPSRKLEIYAYDKRDCSSPCISSTNPLQSTLLVVTVQFLDLNTVAPQFTNCEPILTFSEALKKGDLVRKLTAVDKDVGLDSSIYFELMANLFTENPGSYVTVNSSTGEIRLNRNFDTERDDERYNGLWAVWITVMARDSGTNQLRSYCTMRIQVRDVNDNPPVFDNGGSPYATGILNGTQALGKQIIRVFAIDPDEFDTPNSKVVYEKSTNFPSWLDIDSNTGWITIASTQTSFPSSLYEFSVIARNSTPLHESAASMPFQASATVRIYVVNQENQLPPVVTMPSDSLSINENFDDNSVMNGVVTLPGVGDGNFNAETIAGRTTQTNKQLLFFRIRKNGTTISVRKVGDTDATYIDHVYFLARITRVGALYGSGSKTDDVYTYVRLLIRILDVNDKIPSFIIFSSHASNRIINLPENTNNTKDSGNPVATLFAADKDVVEANRKISYSINPHPYFEVVGNELYVRKNITGFDFEGSTKRYTVTVKAEDGAPSVLAGIAPNHNFESNDIHVTITDVNDMTPYFPSMFYNTSVKENIIVGEPFFTLKAIDNDTVNQNSLTYSMDSKSTPFGIDALTGQLYATRPLDHEAATTVFNFQVKVFDGKFQNFTNLRINVLDVNDSPPIFNDAIDGIINTPSFNVGSVPSPLLKVNITDKDKGGVPLNVIAEGYWVGGDYDYFSISSSTRELEVINKDINPAKNVLRSDRKYHFTLKAVDGVMTSYAQVVVTVTNPLNLAAPCFDMATLNGFQVIGSTYAMKVVASDPDGSSVPLVYSISSSLFSINSATGVVSSNTPASSIGSLHTFDVTVSDASKSTTGTATVTVIGKNSLNPDCTMAPYRAVYDDQIKLNEVFYAVRAGNLFASDRRNVNYTLGRAADMEYFGIKNLPDLDAGGLFLVKALPNMTPRTIVVTVANAMENTTNCNVEVVPTDGNSNPPNIYQTVLRATINEGPGDATVLTTPIKLATYKVNDTDTINTKFVITMSSTFNVGFNPGFELHQTSATQAELFLLKTLDREKLTTGSGPAFVRAVIYARDDVWKYKTATTTFTLQVFDVPETPIFPTTVSPYVNVATGVGARVIPEALSVIPAGAYTYSTDTTSAVWSGTNQPFTFVPATNGASFGLSAARNLANDQGHSIAVPIRVSSATTGNLLTTVTVTVGFQTGQLQNTDKRVSATVSYGWSWYWTPDIRQVNLGSIYALKLYGSDATGVTYAMSSNPYPNYFSLNTTTGNVFIINSTSPGNYTVVGTVKRGSESVTATMNIEATAVGLNALENVASLRLNNMNVDTLVTRNKLSTSTSTSTNFQPSILDQIRTTIAQLIPTTTNKVQIVSVVPDIGQNAVDVYYVASGSPYYTPSKLNTILLLNKAELEKIPGVKVGDTPIDQCAAEPEKCPNGCTNQLKINQESAEIDRQPSSTVVGLKITTEAVCGCGIPNGQVPQGVCGAGSCLNEGNCSVTPGTSTTTCKCPNGFEGPRCQQLYVNFGSPDGYIFSDSMGSCGDIHINFEFVTKQAGRVLLLYTGPLTTPLPSDKDRLSVELNSGVPIVTMVVNKQSPASVTVSNPNPALNDGKWHRLDIWYKDGKLQLMVDRCLNVPLHEYDGSLPTDRTRCFNEDTIVSTANRPSLRRLNVGAYPLQVGGSILTTVYPTGLLGGIGYLQVNGEIRNLIGTKQSYNNKVDTNTAMTQSCYGANKTPVCGANSLCRQSLDGGAARCTCKFGYRKDVTGKCTVQTKIVDYNYGGYTLWKMKTPPTNLTKNRDTFSVMFRTRRTYGTIMYLMGSNFIRNQSLELRIVNSQVVLTINIGDFSFRDVVVPNKNLSDGAWHSAEVQRSLNLFEVLVDGGDVNNYAYYEGSMTSRYNYIILNEYAISGLRVNLISPINFQFDTFYNSFNDSCLTDARLDGKWLPFTVAENNLVDSVATVYREANRVDGCTNNNVCPTPDTCTAPLTCLASIWRPLTRPSCSCGVGSAFLSGFCIPVGVCSPNPCFRGVCSVTTAFSWGYECQCPNFYSGRHCEIYAGTTTASLDGGIIALIVIVILLIIVAILLYCFCVRRKRGDKLLDYPDEDIRENVCHYDEEGAGEEDHGGYDLTDLRKPIHDDIRPIDARHLKNAPPHDNTDLGHFLDGKLKDAEKDPHGPPQDYSLDYGYEGQGSVVDDLSSLGSGTSDGSQHYDHLDKLGPKFKPLHELYNHNHKA